MWTDMPPFVVFFVGALVVALTRGNVRRAALLLTPIISGLHLWGLQDGTTLSMELMGYTLVPFRVDRLSLLFGYLFALAAFLGNRVNPYVIIP